MSETGSGNAPTTEPTTGAEKAPAVRIAFVHLSALCWRFFGYHLMMKAKEAGVALIDRSVSCVAEQITEIERCPLDHIDVLIYRPMATDDPALLAALQRAKEQGVHLIAIDGPPSPGLDVCSISADNFGGQAVLAEYLFKKMKSKGKIAYLQGDLRTSAGVLRNRGLQSVLMRFPKIELVYTEAYNWSSSALRNDQGVALATRALDLHPDLDAIISASDEGALGVAIVLAQRGLRGKVLVSGFDGMPEGITALSTGELDVTARQPLDTMAQLAFEVAMGLFKGEVRTVANYVQDVDLVTRENAGDAAMRALRVFPEVTATLNQRATEQKNSATFLETLFDLMPTMVVVKDAEQLRYIRANKARDEWLKTPRGSQLGKSVHDFYPPELAAKYVAEDQAVLEGRKPLDIPEEETVLEGFGRRYTHTRKIPIYDADGNPDYLMVIAEDITQKKLAKQALAEHAAELEHTREALNKNYEQLVQAEKMAALGALVAGVAHELNTPIGNALMAVTTYSEHARTLTEKLGAGLTRSGLERFLTDATDGIGIMERNLRRAAELIHGFKQVAVDQTTVQLRSFSLAVVVSETLLALSPSLKKTHIVVQQDIPADLVLESFPGPLEQVLINLVNNAVLHGFDGRAEGTISISARGTQPGWVELLVEDNGMGIAPDRIKRIFDPFFSTKFGKGGSGLGLSISNNIVTQLLGGQIAVSSTLGNGTQFCLTLPTHAKNSHE